MSPAITPAPLSGVRVLDLSRLLPGPYLTLILSDLGADVVKVEDTGAGDYLRVIPPFYGDLGGRFVALNRDKRSIAVDLKQPDGVAAFLRLARHADVIVESFRPGVLARLGLDYARLADENAGVILCSLSGYGQDGPYRDRAGHDINYTALAGLLGLSGSRETPELPGIQVADIAGGTLWGAIAVLAALAGRAASGGRGRHLDIAMADGVVPFLAPELIAAWAGGRQPRRASEILNGGSACYGIYRTKDGGHLAVGALEPKFWAAFCQAIGRRGDASEIVAPTAEQTRLRAEIQAILETKSRAEWEAIFAATDACVEPVLEPGELREHPLHRARGTFFTLDDPTRGPLPQVRTPVGRSEEHRPPPRQGEQTVEILLEAGLGESEIERLRLAGVIRAG